MILKEVKYLSALEQLQNSLQQYLPTAQYFLYFAESPAQVKTSNDPQIEQQCQTIETQMSAIFEQLQTYEPGLVPQVHSLLNLFRAEKTRKLTRAEHEALFSLLFKVRYDDTHPFALEIAHCINQLIALDHTLFPLKSKLYHYSFLSQQPVTQIPLGKTASTSPDSDQ